MGRLAVSPTVRIDPVDVPAMRSKMLLIGRPDRSSISLRMVAGIMPRAPPPSMLRIR